MNTKQHVKFGKKMSKAYQKGIKKGEINVRDKYLIISDILFLIIGVCMLVHNVKKGDTFFTISFTLLTIAMAIIVIERVKSIK